MGCPERCALSVCVSIGPSFARDTGIAAARLLPRSKTVQNDDLARRAARRVDAA
jgi:hypothetical protein